MALDFEKIKKDFEKLKKGDLKEYSFDAVNRHFTDFLNFYKVCQKLEDELEGTIEGARKRGNNGTDVKGLSRDPVFKAAFKKYDSSVDDIDKAEKKAFEQTTRCAALATELQTMKTTLKKAAASTNLKAALELHKEIDDQIKDMKAASDIYDVRGAHRKMREYSSKFDDRVQKIIDRGPPPDKPEAIEIPDELEDKEMTAAIKTAEGVKKSVAESCKKINSILDAPVPYTDKVDRLVKKELFAMGQSTEKITTLITEYEKLINKLGGTLKLSLKLKAQPDYKGKYDVAAFLQELHKVKTAAGKESSAVMERVETARKAMS